MVGISGSGKSTWAIDYIKKHPNTYRINRDDLRLTLVGTLEDYYQRKDLNRLEEIVTELETHVFLICVGINADIIVDNTNLSQKYINRWIQESQNTNHQLIFKVVDTTLEEARRNVIYREGWYTPALTNPEVHHLPKVLYIDKQFEQFKQIKDYLKTYHKGQLL